MSTPTDCKDCLYCCGPVRRGDVRYLCVFTCSPITEDTPGCAHHCPKQGWRAFARRLANLLVLKETRLLEAEANPETIEHIVQTNTRLSDILHQEDYERPQE